MDLTVEIHGDAASLEECLEQFTAKECLHGDNMYKCDGYGSSPFLLILKEHRFKEGEGKKKKREQGKHFNVIGS